MSKPAVLFARHHFTADLAWPQLAELLPGWTIRTCPSGTVGDHLDGVDVICPLATRVDAAVLEAGQFGLVQQFGVGLARGPGCLRDRARRPPSWAVNEPPFTRRR